MSAFNRLSGNEEPKLPVWVLRTSVPRVAKGYITVDQLSDELIAREGGNTEHGLSVAEKAEITEYATAFVSGVTAIVQEILTAVPTFPAGVAQEIAEAIWDKKANHALLRAEQGTHTEEEFRAVFGLE